MKLKFTLLLLLVVPFFGASQVYNSVQGKIVSSETLGAMESVNIVNLNQVIGTTTNTSSPKCHSIFGPSIRNFIMF